MWVLFQHKFLMVFLHLRDGVRSVTVTSELIVSPSFFIHFRLRTNLLVSLCGPDLKYEGFRMKWRH